MAAALMATAPAAATGTGSCCYVCCFLDCCFLLVAGWSYSVNEELTCPKEHDALNQQEEI